MAQPKNPGRPLRSHWPAQKRQTQRTPMRCWLAKAVTRAKRSGCSPMSISSADLTRFHGNAIFFPIELSWPEATAIVCWLAPIMHGWMVLSSARDRSGAKAPGSIVTAFHLRSRIMFLAPTKRWRPFPGNPNTSMQRLMMAARFIAGMALHPPLRTMFSHQIVQSAAAERPLPWSPDVPAGSPVICFTIISPD